MNHRFVQRNGSDFASSGGGLYGDVTDREVSWHWEGDGGKLHDMGIFTRADLKARSLAELVGQFGKVGQFYYQIARGEDDRPVVANRVRKSVSAETSYDPDLSDRREIEMALEKVAIDLDERLEKAGTTGQTLTLKVKFADYSQVTRSVTQANAFTEV